MQKKKNILDLALFISATECAFLSVSKLGIFSIQLFKQLIIVPSKINGTPKGVIKTAALCNMTAVTNLIMGK